MSGTTRPRTRRTLLSYLAGIAIESLLPVLLIAIAILLAAGTALLVR